MVFVQCDGKATRRYHVHAGFETTTPQTLNTQVPSQLSRRHHLQFVIKTNDFSPCDLYVNSLRELSFLMLFYV
jgi:hypothetical protein